jgi:DNA-binding Xre family transcriptional regulator
MTSLTINLTDSGAISAKALIAEIIAFAGQKGIDQTMLASRAGISAESLSRLKKAGGCRLSTALELARAAGFKTLDLAEHSAGQIALSLSARKLSAGRRLSISAEELILALRTGNPQPGQRAHLHGFFEDLPIELVHDVSLDGRLDYAHLASLASELGAEGETVDWLAEMAGDRVADAA